MSIRDIWRGHVSFCGTCPENNFHKNLFFNLFGSDVMESMCLVFGTG